MKQFITPLIAVLVGGLLALLAYDYFIVKPRVAAEVRTEQVDLGRARSEARQVADEVETSIQRSVESARTTMDTQAQEMERRALIPDAVQRVTMFRVALTEFYQSNGRWPQDVEEAGLPPPVDMRGGAVREVVLGKQGVVTVSLDSRFGSGSAIVLKPEAKASGIVEWACQVKGDAEIKRALPRCEG